LVHAVGWVANRDAEPEEVVVDVLPRHPQLTDQLAQVVVDYTRMHFQELFTQTLPQAIPVEWERLSFITSVFESLIKSSQIREEVTGANNCEALLTRNREPMDRCRAATREGKRWPYREHEYSFVVIV
jgi:hypothetical protein